MPNFEYTYASWDRLRPGTMPSTGLGEALKKYEVRRPRSKDRRSTASATIRTRAGLWGWSKRYEPRWSRTTARISFSSRPSRPERRADQCRAAAPHHDDGKPHQGNAGRLPHHAGKKPEGDPGAAHRTAGEALANYQHHKEHSKNVALALKPECRQGRQRRGKPHDTGPERDQGVPGGKSAYKNTLPDWSANARKCATADRPPNPDSQVKWARQGTEAEIQEE